MKKKTENTESNIRHRSTFAILFYINRTKYVRTGLASCYAK